MHKVTQIMIDSLFFSGGTISEDEAWQYYLSGETL